MHPNEQYIDTNKIERTFDLSRDNTALKAVSDAIESVKDDTYDAIVVTPMGGPSEHAWKVIKGSVHVEALYRIQARKARIIVQEDEVSSEEDSTDAVPPEAPREAVPQLGPIADAKQLVRLMEQNNWTQAQVADSINKSNGYVSYRLSLLRLPQALQDKITRGELEMMHARELGKAARKGIPEEELLSLAEDSSDIPLSVYRTMVNLRINSRATEYTGRRGRPRKRSDFRSRSEIVEQIADIDQYLDGSHANHDDQISGLLQVKQTLQWVLHIEGVAQPFPSPSTPSE
jgi:ParB/RepB/Spo0J family partition protein